MEMRWLRRIHNPEGLVEEEELPGARLFHLHFPRVVDSWTEG